MIDPKYSKLSLSVDSWKTESFDSKDWAPNEVSLRYAMSFSNRNERVNRSNYVCITPELCKNGRPLLSSLLSNLMSERNCKSSLTVCPGTTVATTMMRNNGQGTEFSLDVSRPFQMGSMTRVGMKKLLRELRYEVPRSSQKLTSQDLRAYFRSKGILSRERYSAYYSDNFPDIAVTYTWNMCLLNKVKQIEKQIVVIDQNSKDIKSELKIQKQYIESPDITWF